MTEYKLSQLIEYLRTLVDILRASNLSSEAQDVTNVAIGRTISEINADAPSSTWTEDWKSKLNDDDPFTIVENKRVSTPPFKLTFDYSRKEVLCERWKPNNPYIMRHAIWWGVDKNNALIACTGLSMEPNCIFSPTLELAEEIVSIRKGEWLPKKGDEGFVILRDNFVPYGGGIKIRADIVKDSHHNKTWAYFPSAEQRQAFINKNKVKGGDARPLHVFPITDYRVSYASFAAAALDIAKFARLEWLLGYVRNDDSESIGRTYQVVFHWCGPTPPVYPPSENQPSS